MATKSFYTPKNPSKYVGGSINKPGGHQGKIICRSNWERQFCIKFDKDPSIVAWSSEELTIPYWCPVKKRKALYYPDFLVKKLNEDGTHSIYLYEIKPHRETVLEATKRRTKRTILLEMTIAVNHAKWRYAKAFCDKRGWKFIIMTERNFKVLK